MADGQSVLDQMTAGIVTRKTEKAESFGLTPVGTEKRGPLDGKQETMFPFDDPQTVRRAIITGMKLSKDMVAEIAHVQDGLRALATLYGLDADGNDAPAPAIDMKVAKEKEADEQAKVRAAAEFARKFDEQSAKAQAQAFTAGKFDPHKATAPTQVQEQSGWSCPTHGYEGVTELTSRRGRVYRACIHCDEFEKPE